MTEMILVVIVWAFVLIETNVALYFVKSTEKTLRACGNRTRSKKKNLKHDKYSLIGKESQ